MTIMNMVGSGSGGFVEGFPQTYLHGDSDVNSFFAVNKNSSTRTFKLDEKYFVDGSGHLGYLNLDNTISSVNMTITLPASSVSHGLSNYGYIVYSNSKYYQVYLDGTVKEVTDLSSLLTTNTMLHYKDEWYFKDGAKLYPVIIGDGTMNLDMENAIIYSSEPSKSFLYKGKVYGVKVDATGSTITWYILDLKTKELNTSTTSTNVSASSRTVTYHEMTGKNGRIFFLGISWGSVMRIYSPFTHGTIHSESVGGGNKISVQNASWVIADDMIYGVYTLKKVTTETSFTGFLKVFGIGDKYITSYSTSTTVGNLAYTATTLYNTGDSVFGVTKDGYVLGATVSQRFY